MSRTVALLSLGRLAARRGRSRSGGRSTRRRWNIALRLRRGERLARSDLIRSYVFVGHDLVVIPLQLGFLQVNAWAFDLKIEVADRSTGGSRLRAASCAFAWSCRSSPTGCSCSSHLRTSCDQ